MTGDFRLVRGVSVPDLTGIAEGYTVRPRTDSQLAITANVSAERLVDVFLALTRMVPDPGFLILELPSHRAIEEELRTNSSAPYHIDSHYLRHLTNGAFEALFAEHAELLVNDGLVRFGYASESGGAQVMLKKYKLITVLAREPEPFIEVIERLGFEYREKLKTVWETFTEEAPGEARRIRIDGRSVFDLIEELEPRGLFFAGRREDD